MNAVATSAAFASHREVWARKPTLRYVYGRYFRDIQLACRPEGPTVELGSGPGCLRDYMPGVWHSDVIPTPWTDLACDAGELPFGDATIGNLILVDVFHHLANPEGLLAGASRVLKPGGRLVLLEPWTGPVSYRFYRHIHHEDADYTVDPVAPFPAAKGALDGNAALPRMFFDPGFPGAAERLARRGLRVAQIRRLPALDWLLTGGFRPYGVKGAGAIPLLGLVETLAHPFRRWIALRVLLVVEKHRVPGPPATMVHRSAGRSPPHGSGPARSAETMAAVR